jgi:hypothetical protein
MSIDDTLDLYNELVKCLNSAYGMKGPWPPAPERESKKAVYNFADFPGIRIRSEQSWDAYVDIAKIVMRIPAAAPRALPCIEFCDAADTVVRRAASKDTLEMGKELRRVIAQNNNTALHSDAELLDIVRSFVQLLALKSGARGP